jgi:transcriptional regulator with XRE-family HTH domain
MDKGMAEPGNNREYVEALEALRGFMRMSQQDFAELIGKSRTFISTAERTKYLTDAALEEILECLGKTRKELLDWYGSNQKFIGQVRGMAS